MTTQELVSVGGGGRRRVLRERGTGVVVDETEIVGSVPELLAELIREQRRTNELLMVLIDEDVDSDSDDSRDGGE